MTKILLIIALFQHLPGGAGAVIRVETPMPSMQVCLETLASDDLKVIGPVKEKMPKDHQVDWLDVICVDGKEVLGRGEAEERLEK